MGSTRIKRNIASDRADLPAGRIRGKLQAMRIGSCGYREVDSSWLHDCDSCLGIKLKNIVETVQGDDDPIRMWRGSPREAGSRSPGDKRNTAPVSYPDGFNNLLRRFRDDHSTGCYSECRQAIGFVGGKMCRIDEEALIG